jgi:hypothetical protein
MKGTLVLPLLGVFALMAQGTIYADCFTDGTRAQMVWLSSGNKTIDRWEVTDAEIHRTPLANGFELGLKIEPATPEKYRELLARTHAPAVPEFVKISVFDMSGTAPKLLTTTWGGANSKQGYGPRGGANRVEAIGEPGIELWLHKAVCLSADEVAKLQ